MQKTTLFKNSEKERLPFANAVSQVKARTEFDRAVSHYRIEFLSYSDTVKCKKDLRRCIN